MSVHWVEAAAVCWMDFPERLLQEALAVHGFRVTSRKTLARGIHEPATNGSLRWSHRRLTGGTPFLWVSDIDHNLGREWWITLSELLDGFVLGYEKWEFRDIHRIMLGLSGKYLENNLYLPELDSDIPDARTLWNERCGLLFDVRPGSLEEATVLEAHDWRLEAVTPDSSPRRLSGGRALLANLPESRFREVAAGGLDDWLWRPWAASTAVPGIDLWNPTAFSWKPVKRWAEAANCLGVVWDIDGDEWRCLELMGTDRCYDTSTRDPISLVEALRTGTTAMGEPPAGLGGRGRNGWRSSASLGVASGGEADV